MTNWNTHFFNFYRRNFFNGSTSNISNAHCLNYFAIGINMQHIMRRIREYENTVGDIGLVKQYIACFSIFYKASCRKQYAVDRVIQIWGNEQGIIGAEANTM